jgi:hypothetical protein
VLEAQIASSDLRGRQGHALSSFEHALPAPDSELVRDAIKNPYNFEFLGLSQEAKERDLELALLNDVQSFLVEMGRGFALVGRQFPLRVRDAETGEEQELFERQPQDEPSIGLVLYPGRNKTVTEWVCEASTLRSLSRATPPAR